MFGPKELDLRNTYNPNLQEIQESAERTYGEANSFYRKEELYLKDVERRIMSGELSSEKDIYDECHAIASDLAKCCEMYLKALYIYEHNIPGNQIDELWEKLKNSEFKTDERGNLIYVTPAGEITFVRYDDNGEPIKDSNGKLIYFDKDNNVYTENNRGSKIKRNGHQLDRLIELLSQESRLLLETRMLTIPMESTEQNNSVSILDVLLKKGVLSQENQISSEQYVGWIEQHKKTFEEARYSGQKKYDVNVEFLYHLATQIKAVVQYRMDPKNNQKFTVTDEELSQLPKEIQQMASFHSYLLSEDLIKLIANSDEIKNKIILLFSDKYVLPPRNVSPLDFYNMIKLMDEKEIIYVSYICYMIQNYDKLNSSIVREQQSKETNKAIEIVGMLNKIGVAPSKVIGFFVQIKETFGKSIHIGNDSIGKLLKILRNKIAHDDYYAGKYYINKFNYESNKINYSIPKIDNNYIYNNPYIFK